MQTNKKYTVTELLNAIRQIPKEKRTLEINNIRRNLTQIRRKFSGSDFVNCGHLIAAKIEGNKNE